MLQRFKSLLPSRISFQLHTLLPWQWHSKAASTHINDLRVSKYRSSISCRQSHVPLRQ